MPAARSRCSSRNCETGSPTSQSPRSPRCCCRRSSTASSAVRSAVQRRRDTGAGRLSPHGGRLDSVSSVPRSGHRPTARVRSLGRRTGSRPGWTTQTSTRPSSADSSTRSTSHGATSPNRRRHNSVSFMTRSFRAPALPGQTYERSSAAFNSCQRRSSWWIKWLRCNALWRLAETCVNGRPQNAKAHNETTASDPS